VAYIYSITNTINDKKYIGKTSQSNPYDRWKQHLQLAKSKSNLQENNSAHSMPIVRAISKYGSDNFKFRVLEECDDDKVNEREKHYIEKYNTAEGFGYNCTYGGEGVSKPKKYWSNHPHSKAVSCYTLEGKWVRDYDTRGLAAYDILNRRPTKSERGCIRSCINGVTFQALGYRWAWKGEQPKVIEKRVNVRGNVYGINPTLGRKKMWKSQADAAEELTGNRKNNANILLSIRSPDDNKLQASGWYFFRSKPTDWTPAKRNTFTSESAKKASKKGNENRKKFVYGISVKTGEIVEFESILEASYFIKGEGNRNGVPNIHNNIQRIKNGQTWCFAYGYRWYEKT